MVRVRWLQFLMVGLGIGLFLVPWGGVTSLLPTGHLGSGSWETIGQPCWAWDLLGLGGASSWPSSLAGAGGLAERVLAWLKMEGFGLLG